MKKELKERSLSTVGTKTELRERLEDALIEEGFPPSPTSKQPQTLDSKMKKKSKKKGKQTTQENFVKELSYDEDLTPLSDLETPSNIVRRNPISNNVITYKKKPNDAKK